MAINLIGLLETNADYEYAWWKVVLAMLIALTAAIWLYSTQNEFKD